MSAQSDRHATGICRGRGESFRSALFSFFKSRIPNFEIPKGFDRTARIWWSQRDRYLTDQEMLFCVDEVRTQLRRSGEERKALVSMVLEFGGEGKENFAAAA